MPCCHSDLSWFEELLGATLPPDGGTLLLPAGQFLMRDGILRAMSLATPSQAQTAEAFGFKWQHRESYDSPAMLAAIRDWLVARYGPPDEMAWLFDAARPPLMLDAGCGSAVSALELFGARLERLHYI